MIKEISINDIGKDLLSSFDCGDEMLNEFLLSYARQNDRKGLGKTFLLEEEGELLGFYTLSSAHIEFAHMLPRLKKAFPRYPIPAIRIARLAVAKSHQKKGIGASLLKASLKRILLASINAGLAFVLVDAKENARGFYEHFGFVRLGKESHSYVLPIAMVMRIALDSK